MKRMSASKAEQDARELAEDSREKKWNGESFLRELFLGNFRLDNDTRLVAVLQRDPQLLSLRGWVSAFLAGVVKECIGCDLLLGSHGIL